MIISHEEAQRHGIETPYHCYSCKTRLTDKYYTCPVCGIVNATSLSGMRETEPGDDVYIDEAAQKAGVYDEFGNFGGFE